MAWDGFDADGIGIEGLESRNLDTAIVVTHNFSLVSLKTYMSGMLHRRAPNTYYGQWPRKFVWRLNGRWPVHCPECVCAGGRYPQASFER